MRHSVHICQQLEAAALSASIFSLQPPAGPQLVKSSQRTEKNQPPSLSFLHLWDIFRTLPLAHRLLHFSKTWLPLQGCSTMQQLRGRPTPVPLPACAQWQKAAPGHREMTQRELGRQERRHQSFRESDLFSPRGTASQPKSCFAASCRISTEKTV